MFGPRSKRERRHQGPGKASLQDRAPQKVLSVRHHSGAQLAVSDPPDQFGTMFSVQVTYHVHEVTADQFQFAHFMVLDTACQRTCSGTLWCDHHEAALMELKLKVKKVACQDTFQFGKGSHLP